MSVYTVSGKVVMVTGGAQGVGAGLTRVLLEQNAKHVAILDVSVDEGKKFEKEMNEQFGSDRVKFIKCDVSNEEDLLSAYEEVLAAYKRINLVFNSAGIFDEIKFKKMVDVNVAGVMGSTMRAIELMRADKGGNGGTVVNVASIAALVNNHLFTMYGATKAAVVYFSNAIGAEPNYNRTKVRVLTFCPGATDTRMLRESVTRCSWDPDSSQAELEIIVKDVKCQSPEEAGRAFLEALKYGKSGSTWAIENGEARDLTDIVGESRMQLCNFLSMNAQ